MKVKGLFAATSALLFLIASGRMVAQEKHPEQLKKSEHPADKNQAGLTKTDLAAAIKTWAEKEAARNDGWLKLEDPVQQKTLQLKLDKVHDDRLSQVKPGVYFACADFVEK